MTTFFPRPPKGGGQRAIDYIIERTLLRPRDVLQFVNECFVSAFERQRVSWSVIKSAEGTYSEKRLNSLYEEWGQIYPCLEATMDILRGISFRFKRSDISSRMHPVLERLMENAADPCCQAVLELSMPGSKISESDIVAEILNCFYKIGVVGVKVSTTDPYIWSDYNNAALSKSQLKKVNFIKVHKMLARSLGVEVKDEVE